MTLLRSTAQISSIVSLRFTDKPQNLAAVLSCSIPSIDLSHHTASCAPRLRVPTRPSDPVPNTYHRHNINLQRMSTQIKLLILYDSGIESGMLLFRLETGLD